MYAVIRAGAQQFKVAEGDVIEVERLGRPSGTVRFSPLLVVEDDGTTRFARDDLDGVSVTGEVLGEGKRPKIEVVKYRAKTGYRRHTGHRQHFTSVRISGIELGGGSARTSKRSAKEAGQDGA